MLPSDRSAAPQPAPPDAEGSAGASWWRRKLGEWFGIDLRSLAIFRIALGLIVCFDLCDRLRDFEAMYAETGIMPLQLARDWWPSPAQWSIFFLSSSDTFTLGVFLAGIVLSLLMIVGCCTRLGTVGCWVVMVSSSYRFPLVDMGGEALVRYLLFWSMFLPLGRCWSFDAWRRPTIDPRPVANVLTFCLMMQVCIMYFTAAYWKGRTKAWRQGMGLIHALWMDVFTRPLGDWILAHPRVAKVLNYAALAQEGCGVLFAFSPFYTKPLRLLTAIAFFAFHISIELTMSVSWFSYASLVAWVVFLPDITYENRFWRLPVAPERKPVVVVPRTRWGLAGMTALSVFYLFSLATTVILILALFLPQVDKNMPQIVRVQGDLCALPQGWMMFSAPPKLNIWFAAEARLRNGEVLDLLSGKPFTNQKPADLCTYYENFRWRQIFILLPDRKARYPEQVARVLAQRWNDRHAEEEQVVSLKFYHMQESSDPSKKGDFDRKLLATLQLEKRPDNEIINLQELLGEGF
ncbi:HTTM domain-containing protein [Lignipirellula cremea]|uniref:HTTM-like domain-containing protein n=1 Tax=Lignipirellula cremea TaxID=2528010 RepID=A0A518DTS7_9BACT|nr:HTTM domain-containing protein [Lignipirellula cremea]QDU95229.1 hypothetical protein Pla8534_30440 [Lignipirellula cremea]